jgi:hypothetical protein
VEYTYENEMAGDTIKANKVTKEINLPDNNGVLEISKYDLLGNLIESTTCKGGTPYTTTYQYSNFGKISSVTQPYEVDGNLTTTKKIMQYDTLGNLLYVQNLMDTPNDTSDDICELYSYNIASLRVEEQCRQRYNGNEAITTYIFRFAVKRNRNNL